MSVTASPTDIQVEISDDHVATIELRRPPNNHIDGPTVTALAETFEALDTDDRVRALVLCSQGRHFCGGADLVSAGSKAPHPMDLYTPGVRLFATRKPIVAAVQGAAVGGGLGLALVADFRVATPSTRFHANFARLGFHQGFGSTVTLPAVVGQQNALDMLYTGRRVDGTEALAMGLADRLVEVDRVRDEAVAFARQIAGSAPLAVASIRATVRGDLAERVRAAVRHEADEQVRLIDTDDFREGVAATLERRPPVFTGK